MASWARCAEAVNTVTDRQFVALYLYYVGGQSQRKIGSVLGVRQQTVWELLKLGRRNVITLVEPAEPVTSPLVRVLTEPTPTTSVTSHSGLAASRRGELLDALERHMAQRDHELADIVECMSGASFSPTHVKRNHYDQWELRYLMRHKAEDLNTDAYDAKNAAVHCAGPADCPLGCYNCHGNRS
jgi:hypothetical protein